MWMDHHDCVDIMPLDFISTSKSDKCKITSFEDSKRRIYGVQFHPELNKSLCGDTIFKNFLFNICKI